MKQGNSRDLALRTKAFALIVVGFYSVLPKSTVAQVLGRQLLWSGTSGGAHYREANRAKSYADFISKIEGALQELDETSYWLDLLSESKIGPTAELQGLLSESEELISIFVAVAKSAKRNPR